MPPSSSQSPIGIVTEVRLTCIWTIPAVEMLDEAPIGNDDGYAALFSMSRPGENLAHPWEEKGSRFWKYYLGGQDLRFVDAGTAWAGLVPLWAAIPNRLSDRKGQFRISTWGLVHPFGVSVMVSATGTGSAQLDVTVDRVLALMRDRSRVEVGTGPRMGFNAAGLSSIDALRKTLGLSTKAGAAMIDPFKIVTFTKTKKIDPAATPSELTRKSLLGLLSGVPEWREAELGQPEQTDVPISGKHRPNAHLVIGTGRGRAVWFPQLSGRPKNCWALGCYHRNLVMGSAQVDALGSLTRGIDVRLSTGIAYGALPYVERQLAERAALRLASLWVGDHTTTYRSWSLRRQIDDEWKPNLVRLLTACGKLPDYLT